MVARFAVIDDLTGMIPPGQAGASDYSTLLPVIATDATTTRTITSADQGKVIVFTSGSAITVTLDAALPIKFSCVCIQQGAGQITFAAGGSGTLQSYGGTKTAGQHATATVFVISNAGSAAVCNVSGALTT